MAQKTTLEAVCWPVERGGEALTALARQAGLVSLGEETAPEAPVGLAEDAALRARWLAAVADRLQIEAEPVTATIAEMGALVRHAGPALLRIPPEAPDGPGGLLAVLRCGWRVVVIAPDLHTRRLPLGVVRRALERAAALPGALVEAAGADADAALEAAGIPLERRGRARQFLLREQCGSLPVEVGWLVRRTPGAALGQQAARLRLGGLIWGILGGQVGQQAVLLTAWWLIGRGALAGQFAWANLWAWALLLLTAIPFQVWTRWASLTLATRAGILFKRRLLYGALQLEPDEVRHAGLGQFLGRVLDAEAVESLALGGGLTTLATGLQAALAGWVLLQGSGGGAHAALLVLWLLALGLLGWWAYRSGRGWSGAYREMTQRLVERMVGYRTRLAQLTPAHWHHGEDGELARYYEASRRYDRAEVWLAALPHGWLAAGLAFLAPTLARGLALDAGLALAVGGVLLAYQALTVMATGVQSLAQMVLAWEQVAPLFAAAARPLDAPEVVLPSDEGAAPQPVVLAQDVEFRYGPGKRQVLRGGSLKIQTGERWVLEGPSGGGKTTLAALLAGLREPESGVLLLRGYDRQSLGRAGWRKAVVLAPQFYENHIFTETLAFNLLLGRRWPPKLEDLAEAEAICQELGLGEVLARMPAGLQQAVGEGGWQLSHGERSRVFIARALLQEAELVVLDESFGALDPDTARLALDCAVRRARALLVITH